MAAKRILLLDGPVLSAFHWHGGHVSHEGEFSPEPVGLEALGAYVRKHRSSLFYVLADVTEEGFQLEDLPYVQGADRAALLQRRLGQYYYNTPLSVAISLGRAREGRRDEKFLFAALTRIETFTPWLDTLREAEAILAGVFSTPLVAAGCVGKLAAEGGPLLLVTITRGGVRQTFFDKGKLHFSRLSQLATRSLEEVGRTCAADSAKIFQYLVAQRQVQRGTALRAVVLAHAAQIGELQSMCINSSDLHFEFVDIAGAGRSLGLKDRPGDSNADALLVHCLAARTPAQQFAAPTERRFYRLWQVRTALANAGWLALAAGLLFAGKTALNVYELNEGVEATRAIAAEDTKRYNGILEGLPKVSLTPDNLRTLTKRVDAVRQRIPGIEPLLVHLSQALNAQPRIELTRLNWRLADRLDAPAGKPEEAKPRLGAGAAAVAVAAAPWTILEVDAQLPIGLASDQRAQLELVEGFAARLRDAKTDVKITDRPFDIESDKAIKSASDRGDTQPVEVPRFSLRIARQL